MRTMPLCELERVSADHHHHHHHTEPGDAALLEGLSAPANRSQVGNCFFFLFFGLLFFKSGPCAAQIS